MYRKKQPGSLMGRTNNCVCAASAVVSLNTVLNFANPNIFKQR